MADAQKLHGFDKILLVLSPEEAQVLADVTTIIGGDPDTSRRGIFDKMLGALEACSFKHGSNSDMTGDLWFSSDYK